jgi:3-deoxy-D-manno-octulosonate 8-phosphate phosphatase (KDO 8-P phosphatase)
MPSITDIFKGSFILSPEELAKKLQHIKAYIFDWDGVFNDAHKSLDGTSSYSETDSMGVNLLRFAHYLKQGQSAPVAVITGEQNKVAFLLAQREHFNAVYYKIKHKETALFHFCKANNLQPSEVLFVFDDVLDFSAAKIAGLRIMVDHSCNPLLVEYAKKNNLVDYLTSHDGEHGAVRESSELIMFLNKLFDKAIDHRATYSPTYVEYLTKRNEQPIDFYTILNDQITEQHPL